MSNGSAFQLCDSCGIVLGVLCWFLLYAFFRRLVLRNQSSEFSSRVVAATHALLVTPLAYACYKEGPNPLVEDGPGKPNTELHKLTLIIGLSYFIYDFCWCIYFGTEPVVMIIHHITSISSLFVILVKGESGAEAVMGLGTMEASNPYLQLRWFMRSAGYNNTPIHTAVELYFFVIFLVMRLGFGTRLTYSILKSSDVSTGVKICSTLLYLISLAFVYYIFQFIKKKYFKRFDNKSLVDEQLKKEL